MRLLSNSQNLQKPFYLFLFFKGSMSRDPPNMQTIATLMELVPSVWPNIKNDRHLT